MCCVAVLSCQTDCVVCGLGPLGDSIVVLGFWRNPSGLPQRPQVHVLQPHPQEYLCTDNLSLRGYQQYTATDYFLGMFLLLVLCIFCTYFNEILAGYFLITVKCKHIFGKLSCYIFIQFYLYSKILFL